MNYLFFYLAHTDMEMKKCPYSTLELKTCKNCCRCLGVHDLFRRFQSDPFLFIVENFFQGLTYIFYIKYNSFS
jgi:hypothetical protein